MLIAIVFKKMPLFNVFQVPRNYLCLIFSVKLENGHEIGPKSIVVYEKIKIHKAWPEICFLMHELVESCFINAL